MGILMIIVGISQIISQFGLGAAIIQKQDIIKEDLHAVLFVSIIIAVLFSIIVLILADGIAQFFNNSLIKRPLQLMSIIFVIDSVRVIQYALAQKRMDFKYISIISVLSYFLGNCLITIILALNNLGIWALVIGYVSSSVISLIAFTIKYGFFTPLLPSKRFKNLVSFGSYYTLARLANHFASMVDYFLIGRILGAQQLGYYSRAYQLMNTPAEFLGGTIQKILFPAYSRIQMDLVNLQKQYLLSNRILAYPSVIIFTIIFIWSEEITRLILGPGWDPTIIPLKILSAGLILKNGYKTTVPVLNALGLVKKQALIEFIYLAAILLGAYIGSLFGINGVSVGVVSSLLVIFIFSSYISVRELNISVKSYLAQYLNSALIGLTIWIGYILLKAEVTYLLIFILSIALIVLYLLKKNYFNTELAVVNKFLKHR